MVLGHVKLSETQAAAGSMESFVLMNWILLSNTQFYSSNLIIEDCIYILTLKTFIQKQFFKIVLKMGFNCFYSKIFVWKLMYNVKVSKVLFTSFSIVAQYVYRKTIANISNLVSCYDMINNVF